MGRGQMRPLEPVSGFAVGAAWARRDHRGERRRDRGPQTVAPGAAAAGCSVVLAALQPKAWAAAPVRSDSGQQRGWRSRSALGTVRREERRDRALRLHS